MYACMYVCMYVCCSISLQYSYCFHFNRHNTMFCVSQQVFYTVSYYVLYLICNIRFVVDCFWLALYARVRRAKYTFDDKHWSHIDQQCKDLVSGLLVVDPSKRLTVDQALNMPWVCLLLMCCVVLCCVVLFGWICYVRIMVMIADCYVY